MQRPVVLDAVLGSISAPHCVQGSFSLMRNEDNAPMSVVSETAGVKAFGLYHGQTGVSAQFIANASKIKIPSLSWGFGEPGLKRV
jgi:hypothetical protein